MFIMELIIKKESSTGTEKLLNYLASSTQTPLQFLVACHLGSHSKVGSLMIYLCGIKEFINRRYYLCLSGMKTLTTVNIHFPYGCQVNLFLFFSSGFHQFRIDSIYYVLDLSDLLIFFTSGFPLFAIVLKCFIECRFAWPSQS